MPPGRQQLLTPIVAPAQYQYDRLELVAALAPASLPKVGVEVMSGSWEGTMGAAAATAHVSCSSVDHTVSALSVVCAAYQHVRFLRAVGGMVA